MGILTERQYEAMSRIADGWELTTEPGIWGREVYTWRRPGEVPEIAPAGTIRALLRARMLRLRRSVSRDGSRGLILTPDGHVAEIAHRRVRIHAGVRDTSE